jgi:hypothetical protein
MEPHNKQSLHSLCYPLPLNRHSILVQSSLTSRGVVTGEGSEVRHSLTTPGRRRVGV